MESRLRRLQLKLARTEQQTTFIKRKIYKIANGRPDDILQIFPDSARGETMPLNWLTFRSHHCAFLPACCPLPTTRHCKLSLKYLINNVFISFILFLNNPQNPRKM